MSRSRIITLALPLACLSSSLAQHEAAIDEYLRPILTASAADPNVEAWSWKQNLNGGYLLRNAIDVTGDGRSEIFVASTLHSSNGEHYWKIFDVAAEGVLRPYEKGLSFFSAWPVTENGETSLLADPVPDDDRLQASDPNPFRVFRYLFSFPRIEERTLFVNEEEGIKLQQPDSGRPKPQAILLADYLTNPDAEWSDADELKRDGSGAYYLEEDKERAAKNVAFTPKVALAQLAIDRSTSKGPEGQIGSHRPGRADPPSIPRQSAEPPSDQKSAPSTVVEESSSSRWWPVVVIVAALSLLWVLIKKRK